MNKHQPQHDAGSGVKAFSNLLLLSLSGLAYIAEVTMHVGIGVYYHREQGHTDAYYQGY